MTYITNKNLKELDLLFQFVPPEKIRKRIEVLFFNYLASDPNTQDIKKMSEDVYFLMRFLERVGEK